MYGRSRSRSRSKNRSRSRHHECKLHYYQGISHHSSKDDNLKYRKGIISKHKYDEQQTVRRENRKPNRRSISTSPISDDQISLKNAKSDAISATTSSDQDNRLERLERMVELLVSNTNALQESISEVPILPNGNTIQEFIPRNATYTTSMWLNRIEEEAINLNYDEGQTIKMLSDNINGVLKAWYNSVSSFNFSWPELKLLIVKTFPDNRDFAKTLRTLVNRKKQCDETWTNYFFSNLYLLECCKITGTNAVSCIIDGFNNKTMEAEAKESNFLTPESLYSMYMTKFPDYEQSVSPKREMITYGHIFEAHSTELPSSSVEDCRLKLEKKKRFPVTWR